MKLNVFEMDLGGWTMAVFGIAGSGFLFYHMTAMKSLPMKRSHASILAICLLLISISYSIYALYNFFVRSKLLLEKTQDKEARDMINQSRIIYCTLTSIICVVLLLICIQITYNSIRD